MLRVSLLDISSRVRPGQLLGGLVYADTFLEVRGRGSGGSGVSTGCGDEGQGQAQPVERPSGSSGCLPAFTGSCSAVCLQVPGFQGAPPRLLLFTQALPQLVAWAATPSEADAMARALRAFTAGAPAPPRSDTA